MAKKTSFRKVLDFLFAADLVVLSYEGPDLCGVFVIGYRSIGVGRFSDEDGLQVRFDFGHGEDVITRTINQRDVVRCEVRDYKIADVFVERDGKSYRYSFEGYRESELINNKLL